jgi:hypothetical protein
MRTFDCTLGATAEQHLTQMAVAVGAHDHQVHPVRGGCREQHDTTCYAAWRTSAIESIDFNRRSVFLISPVPARQVRVLQLGDLYIGRDGRELGQFERQGL